MKTLLLVLALFAVCAQAATAEERIELFASDIAIGADGGLVVTETIAAIVEGVQIRRGIYRDFPTRYRDGSGRVVTVGFEVLAVARDGRPEPWRLEPRGAGVRIWIGDSDVLLAPGRHVWKLRYRSDRQLGFFERHDELYWNVTGNDWTLPIDRAEVAVQLPEAVPILEHSAYTGPQGARGSDFEVLEVAPGMFRARTTRTLQPGEGFTVAIAFPKGVVRPPPTPPVSTGAASVGLPIAGVLAVVAFYLFVWWRVGRDPPPGTVIPLFEPPPGLGPAAARYIWCRGLDQRGFVAALLSLGVKGRLRIVEDGDGSFRLERRAAPAGAPALTPGEQALYETLFAGTTMVPLSSASRARLRAARLALEAAIAREHERAVFRRNRGWFALGVGLSLAVVAGVEAAVQPRPDVVLLGLFAGMAVAFTLASVRNGLRGWKEAGTVRARIRALASALLSLALFLGVLLGGVAMVLLGMSELVAAVPSGLLAVPWTPAGLALAIAIPLLVGVNALFLRLLHAPTQAGRRLLDQLAGFRRYLAVAEESRLGILHPPELTPQRFERYLPWAYALDCDHEWSARFARTLMGAAAPAPEWWRASGGSDPLALSREISSSLASAVATASAPPPGSSSGIGGGSSGGGGGGGGGGGW